MPLRLLILFALTLSPFLILSAQAPTTGDGCGTLGKSPWLEKYQAGLIRPVTKSLETKYVPIQLTIVGDDNGGQYADPLTLIRSFEILNNDFKDIGVQFYIDGEVAYVNSTIYTDHDFTTGRDLLRDFSRSGVFNNFVVANPAGNCGYYSPSQDAIVLGVNCINGGDRTWSHEVGHYFGLPHTFYGWESIGDISEVDAFTKPAPDKLAFRGDSVQVERVDQSNCAEAADGFCDTSPDYLPGRWRCNGADVYPDSLLDPDSTRFVVPGRNIMSYSNDECVSEFSEEQMTAMVTNLDGRLELADSDTPTFSPADGGTQVLISPEPNARVPFSDEVELKWGAVDNADFYLVQLNISTNFNGTVFTSFLTSDTSLVVNDVLTANRLYYWRVRPVNRYDVRGSFSEVRRFRNGSFTTATADARLDTELLVAPNPVGSNREVTVTAGGIDGPSWSYRLFDPRGRLVREAADLPTVGGTLSTSIRTDDLAAGMYFLRIDVGGRFATRRLVVTP